MKPEEAFHRQVADYLNMAVVPPAWWTTFPAGGGGKVRGAVLKACGLKSGVPDVLLIQHGRAYWIELKSEDGVLNPAQKKTKPLLLDAGCQHIVCRSIEEIQSALLMWGFKVRARAAE